MTPEIMIADLDAMLQDFGEDATLRRQTWTNGEPSNVDATVRAFVRGYEARELTGGIVQGDTKVTISPTSLVGWEPGIPAPGDQIVIQGRARQVEAPAPKYVNGVLVRLDIQVRG